MRSGCESLAASGGLSYGGGGRGGHVGFLLSGEELACGAGASVDVEVG